jgi:hypothetical protein
MRAGTVCLIVLLCCAGVRAMDEYSGPDSLVVLHTNGSTPTDPAFEYESQHMPSLSTGVRGSTSRAVWLDFWMRQHGGIRGVVVHYASPACGEGSARLQATGADSLSFRAPGDSFGPSVSIADGERKVLVSGGNGSAYVVVERVLSGNLAGTFEFNLRTPFNGVLSGSPFSFAESGDALASGTVNPTPHAPNPDKFYELGIDEAGTFEDYWLRFTGGDNDGEARKILSNAGITTRELLTFYTPFPNVPEDFDPFEVFDLSGRLHCVMLHNKSSSAISDLELWLPPLGTPQRIDDAYPANGLPATGAGTITIPEVTDWLHDVRFLRITDSSGTEKEIVGGYLVGNTFHVGADGRGLLGTTPAAGASGDEVAPHPGIEIAFDETGVKPFPSIIQGGSVPRDGLDEQYVERVFYDEDGNVDLPAVSSHGWVRDTQQGFGLILGESIPADYRVPVWIHLACFPGERQTPATWQSLAWRYTAGGVTYTQDARGLGRVARDLSAERYRVYGSIGAGVPVDRTTPLVTAASRPIENVNLVDNQINNLEVYKINDYGVEGLIGEYHVELVAQTAGGPPSKPAELRVRQSGNQQVTVMAMYFAAADATPGDNWIVSVETTDPPTTAVREIQFGDGTSELLETFTDERWRSGTFVEVTAWIERTDDGALSAASTVSTTLADVVLGAPERIGVHQDGRRLIENE